MGVLSIPRAIRDHHRPPAHHRAAATPAAASARRRRHARRRQPPRARTWPRAQARANNASPAQFAIHAPAHHAPRARPSQRPHAPKISLPPPPPALANIHGRAPRSEPRPAPPTSPAPPAHARVYPRRRRELAWCAHRRGESERAHSRRGGWWWCWPGWRGSGADGGPRGGGAMDPAPPPRGGVTLSSPQNQGRRPAARRPRPHVGGQLPTSMHAMPRASRLFCARALLPHDISRRPGRPPPVHLPFPCALRPNIETTII